jgi:hypothetical protein
VDREERPDLDQIYQLAFQLMNGRGGGWPLTAFLTPEQTPYFLATYLPPEPRYGMPGLPEVLRKGATFYRDHRADADGNGEAVRRALEDITPRGAGILDRQPVERLRAELEADRDRANGGWGGAPKFPRAQEVLFCLRRAALGDDAGAGAMAHEALRAMTDGGLYDHLGGGFFRYCVDAEWRIPHFEKMLYDNAQLLAALADGYAHSGDGRLREAAAGTVAWLEREMRHPEGGFYATLDAESGGVEGAYYTWSHDTVAGCLSGPELALVTRVYGIRRRGGFGGDNHLRRVATPEDAGAELDLDADEARALLASAEDRLLAARQSRPFVGRDEKVLTAWNGLLAWGLARAGRQLGEPRWTTLAGGALDFLRTHLWDGRRLRAVFKDGTVHQDGFLEDYAFTLWGVLEHLRAEWRTEHLHFARALADAMLELFEDPEDGGLFMSAHDTEPLIHRPKPGLDQSLPSGNGAAARALLELGHLLGEPRYLAAAERTLRLFAPEMKAHPAASTGLVLALEAALEPPAILTLRGGAEATEWQARAEDGYHPGRHTYRIPADAEDLPEGLAERTPRQGATAYLCRGTACSAPITDRAAFDAALAQ